MSVLTASLLAIIAGLLMVIGYLAMELGRLAGEPAALAPLREAHALVRSAPPLQRHSGHHQRRPVTAPIALLGAEGTAAHADVMHELAQSYLPPSPAGEHPYPPYVPMWMPIERKRTEDHAPWTGSQPALDDDAAAEQRRVDLIRSQLPQHEKDVTRADMERALASLRALPAAPAVTESVSAWRPDAAGYGVDRCEADVDEAERLNAGLIA